MKVEPDIKNMTLEEYLKYESKKESRLWRNVRSKGSLTRYEEVDVNSFHRDELLDIVVVDEETDCNPTRDIDELEKLLSKHP
nr:hypothetical protein [Tanacetum cinerariifolium]